MKKLRKTYLVALVFLALSVASFANAGWYFWRAHGVYDSYYRTLERENLIPGQNARLDTYFYGYIEAWQALGLELTLIGTTCLILALFSKKKHFLALALLALSIACFAVAGYNFWSAQKSIDNWNRYVEFLNSIPGPHPPPRGEFERQMIFAVAVRQGTGFALITAGICLGLLALLFYKQTRTVEALG